MTRSFFDTITIIMILQHNDNLKWYTYLSVMYNMYCYVSQVTYRQVFC